MPHTYGVSYFFVEGAERRRAPQARSRRPWGEDHLCRSGSGDAADQAPAGQGRAARYREDSGTSTAAPHGSGVIAAFLSAPAGFIGRPEDVKADLHVVGGRLKREGYSKVAAWST